MHDLAQEVAGVECKRSKAGETDFDNRIRHLLFGYFWSTSWKIPSDGLRLRLLRAFLLPDRINNGSTFSKSICRQVLSSYGCLQALDLHGHWLVSLLFAKLTW